MARPRKLSLADRLSNYALVAVVLLIAALFVAKAAPVYRMGHEMRQKTAELQARVAALQEANKAAEAELRGLQTSRGIEIEARKQFYIRPTEIPVRTIVRDSSGGTGASGEAAPPSPDESHAPTATEQR